MSGIDAYGLNLVIDGRALLDELSLGVDAGASLAVMGPSGSGKTTLLNALAGIVEVEGARLEVAGADLLHLGWSARSRHRLARIGMVFQQPELLPELTVGENVSLPLRLLGRSKAAAAGSADLWLSRVGLDAMGARRPATLSGGEAQRAAVARALVHEPAVLLADEPTGSLDEDNAASVSSILFGLAAEHGTSVVVVTHDPVTAARADDVLVLTGGRLRRPTPLAPSAS